MAPPIDPRLARQTRAARTQFTIAALLGVLSAGAIVAQAALLAEVIAGSAVDHESLARLRAPLIALAVVLAARAALAGAFELAGKLGAGRVMGELRGRLAHALLITRPGRRPRERSGELAAAAVQGVDALESYFAGYLPSLVLASTVPVAIMVWIIPVDPAAAVTLALTIPILVVFMILVGKGAQARTASRWNVLSLLASHFLDVVRGLETLRAHGREQAQIQTLAEVGERYRRETMSTLRLAFLSALVLELCAMIGTALVAATVGLQLDGGHLSLRAGLTVLILAPELYQPLRAVGQQFHASADGLAATRMLMDVLDEAPLHRESAQRCPAPNPACFKLRFEQVGYEYPDRPGLVLDRVELELEPGELTALTGPSGAGKSTIAALALRLCDPTAGRVTCAGLDLRDVTAAEWQAQAAWIPQRAKLYTGTVAENISLPRPRASTEQIRWAAHQAGLDGLLAELPHGLETVIGDGGRRLSAGEGQRVAIARAFVADAGLIVLDEPTANLDPDTARLVGDAIESLADRRTTLLITHDTRLAGLAKHVFELKMPRRADGVVAGVPEWLAA